MSEKPIDRAATDNTPTVAVAFSGGGARGFAHIHVIEALDELGIRPVAITGSSIGALMGAAMAAGMTGREIRDHVLSTVGNKAEVANRLWKLRPATMRDAMSGGFRVGQFNLERILRGFLPDAIPDDFSKLEIPLKVTATDYYGQCGVLIGEGALFPALAASAAIPAVFMPVTLDGRIMIDGGICDPLPFEPLFDVADIVIGVDVVGGPEGDGATIPTRIESLFGAAQLMMQSVISAKANNKAPDLVLKADVNQFRVLDFLRAAEVLDATASLKEELKTFLDAEFTYRAKT